LKDRASGIPRISQFSDSTDAWFRIPQSVKSIVSSIGEPFLCNLDYDFVVI
jgi:hypothetical protein